MPNETHSIDHIYNPENYFSYTVWFISKYIDPTFVMPIEPAMKIANNLNLTKIKRREQITHQIVNALDAVAMAGDVGMHGDGYSPYIFEDGNTYFYHIDTDEQAFANLDDIVVAKPSGYSTLRGSFSGSILRGCTIPVNDALLHEFEQSKYGGQIEPVEVDPFDITIPDFVGSLDSLKVSTGTITIMSQARRVVTVTLMDNDPAILEASDGLVATYKDIVTQDSNEITIQEILMSKDVKGKIATHNKVREGLTDEVILKATGQDVKLRPIKLKDLNWTVRD